MSEYRMREHDEENEANETSATLDPGRGRRWAIAGIICGVGAFLFALIGVVGVVLGIVARKKGAGRIATVAIVLSVVCTVLSVAINVLFFSLASGGGAGV